MALLRGLTDVVQRLRAGDTELGLHPLGALALDRLDPAGDALSFELRALARALQGLVAGYQRQLATLKTEKAARAALEDKLHDRTHRLTAANLQLEAVMRQDPLTGVPNRYAFHERLRSEHARMRQHGGGYAVLALDIDHFKRINDAHGHAVGDAVLREVAQRARGALRQSDFLARTGGEEFIALLPQTDAAGAVRVAEKIRLAVAGEPVAPAGTVTVSVGVSLATPEDAHAESALAAADQRLYAAKRTGRNRVCGPHHLA